MARHDKNDITLAERDKRNALIEENVGQFEEAVLPVEAVSAAVLSAPGFIEVPRNLQRRGPWGQNPNADMPMKERQEICTNEEGNRGQAPKIAI